MTSDYLPKDITESNNVVNNFSKPKYNLQYLLRSYEGSEMNIKWTMTAGIVVFSYARFANLLGTTKALTISFTMKSQKAEMQYLSGILQSQHVEDLLTTQYFAGVLQDKKNYSLSGKLILDELRNRRKKPVNIKRRSSLVIKLERARKILIQVFRSNRTPTAAADWDSTSQSEGEHSPWGPRSPQTLSL